MAGRRRGAPPRWFVGLFRFRPGPFTERAVCVRCRARAVCLGLAWLGLAWLGCVC